MRLIGSFIVLKAPAIRRMTARSASMPAEPYSSAPICRGSRLAEMVAGRVCRRAIAVTQAGHTLMVEQVGIDARSLRRDVGTHPHGPPGQLVNQLEGPQLQFLAGPGEQATPGIPAWAASPVRSRGLENDRAHERRRCSMRRCLGRQGIGEVFG